jgi:hypothetical protein
MNRDTAQYIADMILQLRNLAKGSHMSTLQGLLEISYYEAFSAANAIVIPEGEEQRLEDIGAHARRFAAPSGFGGDGAGLNCRVVFK